MQSSMLTGALSMYDNALKKVSLIDFISEDKAKALDAGMNDHVAKPIDMNILIETMLKYL